MKITKEQFLSLYSDTITKKEYDSIISKINSRVDEIVDFCFDKKQNKFWYDYNNEDGEHHSGFFDPNKYNENIGLFINNGISKFPYYFADSDSIPVNWLWDDFEDFLIKNENELKSKEEEKKNKAKEIADKKKEEKNKIIISIKKKLTVEELKYIIFK